MVLFSRHGEDAVVWSLGKIYFCAPLCQAHQQEEKKEKEIQMQNYEFKHLSCEGAFRLIQVQTSICVSAQPPPVACGATTIHFL